MYSNPINLVDVLANEDKLDDIVLMVGGLHIIMNFLSAVGKVIVDFGWEELFTLSGTFTQWANSAEHNPKGEFAIFKMAPFPQHY